MCTDTKKILLRILETKSSGRETLFNQLFTEAIRHIIPNTLVHKTHGDTFSQGLPDLLLFPPDLPIIGIETKVDFVSNTSLFTIERIARSLRPSQRKLLLHDARHTENLFVVTATQKGLIVLAPSEFPAPPFDLKAKTKLPRNSIHTVQSFCKRISST